jgi:3',5'-cyclic AMP phosphodiesterase CpdA
MPVSLPAPTRRKFLSSLGAAFVSLPLARSFAADVDEDLIAILNDTHIGEKQPADSPVPLHLRTTVDWLLALPKRPAAVLINGDLALKDGQPGDYRHFAKLIQPLRDAGMPVHLTMGNHDERDVFYGVLSAEKPEHPVVAAKHVTLVQTPRANFFLLDTLQQVMVTPGEVGREQLAWLGKALDARADKPAIIMAHHNPRLGGDPLHFPGGLTDSEPLWDMLATRRQVKAYLHGHIHFRSLAKHQDIHIVNTPATSYVAKAETSTTGWTMARLGDAGMTLMTHTHIEDHPWNKQVDALAWHS